MAEASAVYQKIIEVYQKEQLLYEELLQLAASQLQLLQKKERETIPTLVGERDGLVKQLQQLEHELESSRVEWRRIEPELEEQKITALREVIESISSLMEQIVEKDQESAQLMTTWAEEASEEFSKFHKAKNASRAYHDQAKETGSGGSILIDRLSD